MDPNGYSVEHTAGPDGTIMFFMNDNNATATTLTNATTPRDEDKPYHAFYVDAQFVTGLICYPLICFPGLVGNILILVVLSTKAMQTSTNIYLTALAVSDIIKLLNDILYFFTVLLSRTSPVYGNRAFGYLYPYAHFFFNMSTCVSSWLIVCVAVERYILVCHPTRAKGGIVSIPRARLITVLCFLIMTAVAVPSALRYKTVNVTKVVEVEGLDSEGGTVVLRRYNVTELDVELTELYRINAFVLPYTWLQNLLRSIVPLFILVFMNAFIINALRQTRANKKNASRNRITVMLIVVIIFFLLCIIPDAVMSAFFQVGYTEAEDFLVKAVREITDMLLAVNAAMNFLLYIVFNKIFRDQFVGLFCRHGNGCCCCYSTGQQQQHHSNNKRNTLTASAVNGKSRGTNRDNYKKGGGSGGSSGGGGPTYQKLEVYHQCTNSGGGNSSDIREGIMRTINNAEEDITCSTSVFEETDEKLTSTTTEL